MNNKNIRITIIKYLITVGVALGVALAIMSSRGVLDGSQPLDQTYRYLSDAFFVPGAILVSVGALVLVSTTGFFDSLGYVGMIALRALIPGMRLREGERFADYKERKSEKRATGYSFLFFVGLAFLVIGVVFTVLFYNA